MRQLVTTKSRIMYGIDDLTGSDSIDVQGFASFWCEEQEIVNGLYNYFCLK